MKISINWIKDFVDLEGISNEEIINRFTLSTAEIEDVYEMGKETSGVVVAKILEVKNHPESTKLHILKVDKGDEVVQIVCGAPNVREGMLTALATLGGKVNGHKISKAKLVGVESFGMCCSEEELGIGSDNSGIMDIKDLNAKVGMSIKDLYPIDDTVFEIDNKSLTNRPDLWGHYGIAREIACIFGKKLKPLELDDLSAYAKLPKLALSVENPDCYRYSAITVGNVNTHVSPMIMKIRLNYVGMRDINLLADMTNYIMLELGQPMHAFDNAVVKGITVVKSKKGEKMLTLEREEHLIPENSCLICDDKKVPVAIAGIKGGLLSGITDNTNSLLLESATFDAMVIRKTSTAIGLKTDASLRYEKSLDPELTTIAISRLLYILKNIDKNIVVTSSLADVYNKKYPKVQIVVSKEFIEKRIGISISKEEIEKIFTGLEFDFSEKDGVYTLNVPTFRATKDISIKEDIVEEVARVYGYDKVVPVSCAFDLQPVTQDRQVVLEYKTKRLLAEKYGVSEVHSYIWNYENFNTEYGIKTTSYIGLMDASNSGQTGIRSELMPTLLKMFAENKNSFADVRIAEIGRVATGLKDNLAVEEKRLAVLLASDNKTEKALYFEMKKILENICSSLMETTVEYDTNAKTPKYYHPVNSCAITKNGLKLGAMGVLSPTVNIDRKFNVVMLEINFGELCKLPRETKQIAEVSKYQDVNIDLNFLVDKTLPYSEVKAVIDGYKTKLDMTYTLKDIFESEQLGDKKSMTFTFNISSKNKTLTSEDIDKFTDNLLAHMEKYEITLRA